jgi:Region in Clathrin and VPS
MQMLLIQFVTPLKTCFSSTAKVSVAVLYHENQSCYRHADIDLLSKMAFHIAANSWLEARVATGNTETATHNAVGKIYVTLNKDPKTWLQQNQFYDPRVLGKYCEKLDPRYLHTSHYVTII